MNSVAKLETAEEEPRFAMSVSLTSTGSRMPLIAWKSTWPSTPLCASEEEDRRSIWPTDQFSRVLEAEGGACLAFLAFLEASFSSETTRGTVFHSRRVLPSEGVVVFLEGASEDEEDEDEDEEGVGLLSGRGPEAVEIWAAQVPFLAARISASSFSVSLACSLMISSRLVFLPAFLEEAVEPGVVFQPRFVGAEVEGGVVEVEEEEEVEGASVCLVFSCQPRLSLFSEG
jgi:hypothetical protein